MKLRNHCADATNSPLKLGVLFWITGGDRRSDNADRLTVKIKRAHVSRGVDSRSKPRGYGDTSFRQEISEFVRSPFTLIGWVPCPNDRDRGQIKDREIVCSHKQEPRCIC